MRAVSELKAWLGDLAGAAEYAALHGRMATAFSKTYWVEDSALCIGCGYFHDWVDATGRARSYFYVWQNFFAIEAGIASEAQGIAIIKSADALYAQVRAKYNVTNATLWCTPTNLRATLPEDLTVNFDNEYNFGYYENGACFHWHNGLEIMARARVQGPDAAFARFEAAMGVFASTRLWGQRYSWISDPPGPEGSDVITDAGVLLYGAVFGSLNVRPNLAGGLTVLGPAATALEGASFTFALLGKDVTVNVTGGFARIV